MLHLCLPAVYFPHASDHGIILIQDQIYIYMILYYTLFRNKKEISTLTPDQQISALIPNPVSVTPKKMFFFSRIPYYECIIYSILFFIQYVVPGNVTDPLI